jgi:hypothetical protein
MWNGLKKTIPIHKKAMSLPSLLTYICLLFILALLPSCRGFYEPFTLDMEVPDGPENYQAGWYSGCRSAIASMPNYANSVAYDITFANGQYQDDPVFQAAWSSAFFSCSIHVGTFRTFGGNQSMNHALQ